MSERLPDSTLEQELIQNIDIRVGPTAIALALDHCIRERFGHIRTQGICERIHMIAKLLLQSSKLPASLVALRARWRARALDREQEERDVRGPARRTSVHYIDTDQLGQGHSTVWQ